MISLELAQALRDAGLKREFMIGDSASDSKTTNPIWLPRLDQLLAEIERLFEYDFGLIFERRDGRKYWLMAMYGYESDIYNTPEEAAAQALLWILKEGQDG